MRELSLHIMDIVQNSIVAKASLIELTVDENLIEDYLKIIIKDNGHGIDPEMLKNIKDPFVTSRKTRKVGLGISLFEANCTRCDGYLNIESDLGIGTTVTAFMKYMHIDRSPIGELVDTIISLLLYPEIDLLYTHIYNQKSFIFDTREIKKMVGEDITHPEIISWLKDYLDEGLSEIKKTV